MEWLKFPEWKDVLECQEYRECLECVECLEKQEYLKCLECTECLDIMQFHGMPLMIGMSEIREMDGMTETNFIR